MMYAGTLTPMRRAFVLHRHLPPRPFTTISLSPVLNRRNNLPPSLRGRTMSSSGESMRAAVIDTDAKVARPGTAPKPVPKEGEVLLRVHCSALNRADLMQVKGLYPPPPGASELLGLEVAGEVESDGCDQFPPGSRAMALVAGGGYAEYCAVPIGQLMHIPAGMSFEEAAAIPEAWLTAWQAAKWIGGLMGDPTDPDRQVRNVLFHAGASGVGSALIQLAKQLPGCKIAVTAGSAEKLAFCRGLGADLAINYKEQPDWEKEVMEFTGGSGVDLIVDPVGAPYLQKNIDCMAVDARMVILAFMGGSEIGPNHPVQMRKVLIKRIRIQGSTLRARTLDYKRRLAADFISFCGPRFERAVGGAPQLKPVVDRSFGLSDVESAHECMKNNENKGKIILKIAE